jgi:1,4-alpha-glucan branching enzyme
MAGREFVPKKETFRFTAADAMSVLLAGDFTHWQAKAIPMRKGPDGIWTASVQLSPGAHNYRFIVDGEWRDDPDCTIHVANPYGSENMVRRV